MTALVQMATGAAATAVLWVGWNALTPSPALPPMAPEGAAQAAWPVSPSCPHWPSTSLSACPRTLCSLVLEGISVQQASSERLPVL